MPPEEILMNSTTEFDIQSSIREVVINIFQTMLNLEVAAAPDGTVPAEAGRVGATIGLAGDQVTGAIYLHLPEGLARSVVNAMLGNPPVS
jgi:CheY-specific phosphatase CheX